VGSPTIAVVFEFGSGSGKTGNVKNNDPSLIEPIVLP
jgi:hypothetical protein